MPLTQDSPAFYLKRLARRDPVLRREELWKILAEEGFRPELQEEGPSAKHPGGIKNFLAATGPEAPGLLFCAHYDAVPGSPGANDNAAGVCILIRLARTLRAENITARFAFFDGEESGRSGSRLYVSRMDSRTLTGAVALDMCGYGDSLAICGRGNERAAVFRSVCAREFLEPFHGRVVPFLPAGDEASFARTGVPALSVAMVPYWDIQYLKTLAAYGAGFLGRPPEFDIIMGEMEVSTTMHGGFRDSPDWIQPEAMENVYQYLHKVAHTPPNIRKKRFGDFFGRGWRHIWAPLKTPKTTALSCALFDNERPIPPFTTRRSSC